MAGPVREEPELPPPLMTSEPGSFARQTIVERKPQIIQQVIVDNGYPVEIEQRLAAFSEEIASQAMRPLEERAPDTGPWNEELHTYQGRTWLELPWYLAEALFYRRLLEAVGYFQPGRWQGHDPFGRQKRMQMERAVAQVSEEWAGLEGAEPALAFEALLYSSLWGNRADLSNYTVKLGMRGGLAAREEQHNLLIDHTGQVQRYLAGGPQDRLVHGSGAGPGADCQPAGLPRADFVNDNVGLELLFDLALADLLLRLNWAQQVVMHLKATPFFVSDAMPADVGITLTLLSSADDDALRALGERLRGHLEARRLVLRSHPFWTTWLMFRQFPTDLSEDLAQSSLIILKGDVNYRRLLDDRHWPYTSRLEEIAACFPAPFLVLRTLKGELVVGLAPGQAEALAASDPTWLTNGRRGLIQFCRPGVQMTPEGIADCRDPELQSGLPGVGSQNSF